MVLILTERGERMSKLNKHFDFAALNLFHETEKSFQFLTVLHTEIVLVDDDRPRETQCYRGFVMGC